MCLLPSLMFSGTERLDGKCFSGQRNKLQQLPANHRIIVLLELDSGCLSDCHVKTACILKIFAMKAVALFFFFS